ncbi:outer membrane beta-barrel protein [Helicobacter suis]|uniref:outer membrane beta-barrel protein n=1 Tax=Helicobacter suis TaxID=104628 RepID=UPI0013D54482|nr:outer membrane beta-barrel protein [Helicobacter suis]
MRKNNQKLGFQCSLVLCVSLASLGARGGDIRDGVYLEGSAGAQNMALTSQTQQPPVMAMIHSTSLQNSIKTHLQELISKLTSLNTTTAQVGTTKNVSEISAINASATLAEIQSLEAQIANEISLLQRLIASSQDSQEKSSNQAILSAYQQVLQSLKSVGGNLESQINQYNNKLSSEKSAYDTAQGVINKLKEDTSSCIGISKCNAGEVPQTSQLQQDIIKLVSTSYNILNNDIKAFLSNPASALVIPQGQYSKAISDADSEVTKCGSLNTSSAISTCFGTLRTDMFGSQVHKGGVSVAQLAEIYEWFSKVGSQVLASKNTELELELLKIYNDSIGIATITSPADYGLKNVTPPKLGLTYTNQSSTITTDQTTTNNQHNLTPMQALLSLAPLSNTINSLSRPFGNVNWNATIGVGYQYFFSRHFGFDAYINTQYSYLNSPLLKHLANFKALQGVSWGIGADLIYDILVAKGQQKWFAGLFAGFAVAGNYYYLDMKETPLARTAGYNVLFNWGVRFQRQHSIFKIGVKNPLITRNLSMQANNTTVILNKSAKSANIYISYAYLF